MKRKGDISTVLAGIVVITILAISFFMYMETNITTMKFSNLSQIGRDTLLCLESASEIDRNYLLDVKSKATDKLSMKTGDTFNIYLKVGSGNKELIETISEKTTPIYGEEISISLEYNYSKKFFDLSKSDGVTPSVQKKQELMKVELSTISKNRGTSDG